jgi:ribA/ribD-fused uncharacterized protein
MDTTPAIDSFHGDYAFLSNFYPASIEWEGITYPTTEHAFQAAKTLDVNERKRIAALPRPGQAKHAGKRVQLRPDWEHVKVGIMTDIVATKFETHPDLLDALEATGDAKLIEGNHWNDTFWGMCRGRGRNELGNILMRIRSSIQLEDDSVGDVDSVPDNGGSDGEAEKS